MKRLPFLLVLFILAAFVTRTQNEVYLPVIFGQGLALPTPTPTDTPSGSLPTLENPGFEDGPAGWGTSSDNYTDLITDDNPYRTPYAGSWLAWLGRYPDFASASTKSENSWLYQQVAFPADMGSAYFGFYYSLESFENTCKTDPPRDYLDVYLGPDLGTDVASESDQRVGRLILCNELNTQDWVQHIWPADLSIYAGQTLYLKILVAVNNNSPSHLFLDDLFFTSTAP